MDNFSKSEKEIYDLRKQKISFLNELTSNSFPTKFNESVKKSGATAIAAVKGSLEKINIIDSGFDYIDEPIIKIFGSNLNKIQKIEKMIENVIFIGQGWQICGLFNNCRTYE